VPDSLTEFVARRGPTWDQLDDTLQHSRARDPEHGADRTRWIALAYRQVVADLAYARRRFPGDPITTRLERLARAARAEVYGDVGQRASFLGFVRHGFWRRVREKPVFLLIAAILLFGPVAIVGLWAHGNPDSAAKVAQVSPLTSGIGDGHMRDPDTERITAAKTNAAFSAQIFTNNVQVAFAAFAGGLTAGVLTGVSLVFNGLIVGLVAGLATRAGNGEALVRLLAPHGVLELSLIVVAGAAGLRVGWALLRPGHRSRVEALATEGRAAVEMALGAGLLLVPCGFVEGFVTPRGLALGPALAVGFGLGGLFWALVLWLGRPARPTGEPTP
jgi:uncharacterized membrane protein SpoIIM required for sporulation